MAALDLRCRTRAFSSGERGLLSSCGAQAPHVAASLAAEHRLGSGGTRFAASRHVESSQTREVPVPCIGRQLPLDHQGSPVNWFLTHFDLYNHKLLFVSFSV